jgi:hypothetical protein
MAIDRDELPGLRHRVACEHRLQRGLRMLAGVDVAKRRISQSQIGMVLRIDDTGPGLEKTMAPPTASERLAEAEPSSPECASKATIEKVLIRPGGIIDQLEAARAPASYY